MPTHAWTRTYLALLDCNVAILDSVFVHWPLAHSPVRRGLCLDGALHCIWGPAFVSIHARPPFVLWYQQGLIHRTDGPADRFLDVPQWAWWFVRGQKIDPPTHVHAAPLSQSSPTAN